MIRYDGTKLRSYIVELAWSIQYTLHPSLSIEMNPNQTLAVCVFVPLPGDEPSWNTSVILGKVKRLVHINILQSRPPFFAKEARDYRLARYCLHAAE